MLPGTPSRRPAIALILLCAFVLLAYLPSFEVPFTLDDAPNIVSNPRVQPDSWSELLDSLDGPRDRNRPVAKFTFALNYLVGGLDPWHFHAVNLAIHLANTALLFFLLWRMAEAPRSPHRLQDNAVAFAFAAALLWAVHPVNTQAVTYIVQRIASLATFFYLAGLSFHVLWRSDRLRLRWAIPGFLLAFGLGIQTKLIVATLPAAVLLIDVTLYSDRLRRVHWLALSGVVLCGIALAAIYASDHLRFLAEAPPQRDFSGIERLMTQARVIWHYLSLLVWPDADRLQLDYDFRLSRGLLDPPTTLVAALGLLALVLAALAMLRRWPWPSLGWLFFLLALSVESSVILLELVFEHRLYLPSTLLIAGVLAPMFSMPLTARQRSGLSIGILLLAGLLSWQTVERNEQWQDLGRLWAMDLERGASLYRAALNGGIAFLRAGETGRALQLFERIEDEGVAVNDRQRGKIAQLKGEAHFRDGEPKAALHEFQRALELRPRWTRTAYFAGMSLIQLDRIADARGVLAQMKEQQPESVFTASLEAELIAASESRTRGIEHLRTHLEAATDLAAANRSFLHLHLGNMYRETGDLAAAARHYGKALDHSADNWAARASLAEVQSRLQRRK